MIGYSCTNCGHTISVQDEYLSRRIKCPECNCVGVVIDGSGRIKITCKNCGNENNVPQTLSGKKTNCPKCNSPVEVPSEEIEPAEDADNNLNNKIPENPDKSEITERNLIIIISAIAAVIVIGLIIMAVIIPSYKSRMERKSQDMQTRRQVDDTQPIEQNVQNSDEKALRLINALKWEKSTTVLCAIIIPGLILLFCYIHWCPECRKMWAMKRITPFIHSGKFIDYECKYCGHIQRLR